MNRSAIRAAAIVEQTRIPIMAVDVNALVISVPNPATSIRLVTMIARPVCTVVVVSDANRAPLLICSILNRAR